MGLTWVAAALLLVSSPCLSLGLSLNATLTGWDNSAATAACGEIKSLISAQSELLDGIQALSPDYLEAIRHWFLSSSQSPTCVLNAGSPEDVAIALKVVGRRRVPFAFRSGGHATNPGFSSTPGVHIWPGRMQQVTLSADKSIVELGTGLTWADTYKKLDGSGVGVAGGRVPGPGVGGFVVGGGFSWATNEHGLTVDNVVSYNLVLPNGTITVVDSTNPDLFFALKGGLNRFGLVTSVRMKTFPQGKVWGGIVFYLPDQVPALIEATARFDAENTDPRAQVIVTLEAGLLPGINCSSIALFYHNGPEKPAIFSLFDDVIGIDTRQSQSFSSMVASVPSELAFNAQGLFSTMCVTKFTPTFLRAVLDENNKAGYEMLLHGGGPFPISYEIDPFAHNYGQYATDSAYPHADSPLPIALYYSWLLKTEDAFWYNYAAASLARLRAIAKAEGILHPLTYVNYAVTGTTAQELYGDQNAARLRRIRQEVDPENVMGLAGGFDI